jgi:hypothetical protein
MLRKDLLRVGFSAIEISAIKLSANELVEVIVVGDDGILCWFISHFNWSY